MRPKLDLPQHISLVEAGENHVTFVNTKTGDVLDVGLCELGGAIKAMKWLLAKQPVRPVSQHSIWCQACKRQGISLPKNFPLSPKTKAEFLRAATASAKLQPRGPELVQFEAARLAYLATVTNLLGKIPANRLLTEVDYEALKEFHTAASALLHSSLPLVAKINALCREAAKLQVQQMTRPSPNVPT